MSVDNEKDEIKVLNEEPLVLRLCCSVKKYNSFGLVMGTAKVITELHQQYPGKSFQFIPIYYNAPSGTNPELRIMIAIAS
ncbi:MAG: hypothetical protein Q8Q36_02190 [bacterium]|nr:hypothetical protein [bacterium]